MLTVWLAAIVSPLSAPTLVIFVCAAVVIVPTRVLPVTAPLDVNAPCTFTIPVPFGFSSMFAFELIFSIVFAALLIFKLPNSGALASAIVISSVFCVSATLLSPFKLLKRSSMPVSYTHLTLPTNREV